MSATAGPPPGPPPRPGRHGSGRDGTDGEDAGRVDAGRADVGREGSTPGASKPGASKPGAPKPGAPTPGARTPESAAPDAPDAPDAAGPAAWNLRELPEELAIRLPQLLEAMVCVGSGTTLRTILDRIVATAVDITGARYAAIGVLNDERDGLAEFVPYGVPDEVRERIGRDPNGHSGIIGALIRDPQSLRLADLTKHPYFEGFPPGHPPMRSFLGVPVRVGDEVFGNFYLAEKQYGAEFTEYDLHAVRVLATQAGIQISNAHRYATARQSERWIDGAAALTTALLAGGEPGPTADDALRVVAEQGRRLADAAAGVVLLPREHGGLEIVQVSSELPEPKEGVGTVMAEDSPVYEPLLAGEPVFVDDSATDPRMTTPVSRLFGPSMMLPLKSGDRVLGILALPRLRGADRFTRTERSLALRFAAQAALALMMAEAQRDRERLAVYEDRDRIARDLHDLVVQRLFATGMMLEGTQRRAEVPEVQDGISKAVDELDLTIQEIRTAIFALQQGPAETPSGLRTRIEREAHTASVPLGFRPAVRFTGAVDARVGERTGRNLIAALREALSNTVRHAGASRVEVRVDATAELPDGRPAVRLTVADDGSGMPEGGRRSGLRNLARRAESLGGSSRVGAGLGEDGGGAAVIWEAPL